MCAHGIRLVLLASALCQILLALLVYRDFCHVVPQPPLRPWTLQVFLPTGAQFTVSFLMPVLHVSLPTIYPKASHDVKYHGTTLEPTQEQPRSAILLRHHRV